MSYREMRTPWETDEILLTDTFLRNWQYVSAQHLHQTFIHSGETSPLHICKAFREAQSI